MKIAALVIALALVGSTYLVTESFKDVKMKNGKIAVKGYAQKTLVSDLASWHGRLSVRAEDIAGAYTKLEEGQERLFDFLKDSDVVKEMLTCSPVQTETIYKLNSEGNLTHEIEAYELSQSYCLTSTDVEKVAYLSEAVSSLLKEGIHFQAYAPYYYYTKLDEMKIEMLGEAAKDARARAEQLTRHGGGHVGEMLSAHQGVFQITPLHATTTSDYGENDTSSVAKTIKAIVTLEYSIR